MADIISREEFSVVDLVSEGPIEGPVDNAGTSIRQRIADENNEAVKTRLIYESIYLNNTPVKEFGKDNYNFRYVAAEYRSGLDHFDNNNQGQPALSRNYFHSQSANVAKNHTLIGHIFDETTVDSGDEKGRKTLEVSLNNGAIPLTHYIENPDVDSLIITCHVVLTTIDGDSKTVGSHVSLGIRAKILAPSTEVAPQKIYKLNGKVGGDPGLIQYKSTNVDSTGNEVDDMKNQFSAFGEINDGGDEKIITQDGEFVKIKGFSQSGSKVSFKLDLTEIQKENVDKRPVILTIVKCNSEKFNTKNRGRTTRSIRVDTITEQISEKLNYPNAALMGVVLDSRGFSQEPTRTYDLKLLKVKVPSNYTPWNEATKVGDNLYNGVWNGSFSNELQWTSNPAWIFYDLITNKRYGLGKYGISEENIDKWGLYEIARYCDAVDELGNFEGVPTGFESSDEYGKSYPTREPRFTCNIILNQRQDALELMQNFASIFNGLVFWGFGTLSIVSDLPKEPIMLFTDSDVSDAGFNYSDSAKASRVTVVKVRYNDRFDHFKPKIEYKDDVDGIQKYGIIEQETIAFGCTSRGQAQRMAKWLLYSNLLEKESISFIGGVKASYLRPGDIISIQDSTDNPKNIAGRIANVDYTSGKIKIDVPIFDLSIPSKISFVLPTISSEPSLAYDSEEAKTARSSLIHQAYITDISEDRTELTLREISAGGDNPTSSLPDFMYKIMPGTTWVLNDLDVNPEIEIKDYKVMSVAEKEPGQYAVVALEYIDNKFDIIDKEANISLKEYSLLDSELFPSAKISSPTITGRQIINPDPNAHNQLEVTIYQVAEEVDYYEIQMFQDGLPRQHKLGAGIRRIPYDSSIPAGQPYTAFRPKFQWRKDLKSQRLEVKAYAVKDGVYSSESNDRDGIY